MQEPVKVLDKGYIRLTHKMLDENDDATMKQTLDEQIVGAARVSYGDDLKGEEKDKRLLSYLMEHEHFTPLEMAVFRFEVKCPMYIGEQWLRHRWSSFNKLSGRYTDDVAVDYYVPTHFRAQDMKNKQGSVEGVIHNIELYDRLDGQSFVSALEFYKSNIQDQKDTYNKLVAAGVAKEQARGVLGASFYSKFVWTVNARSLANFLILRCESHAQWEAQQYAWAVLGIMEKEIPWTIEALKKIFHQSFTR